MTDEILFSEAYSCVDKFGTTFFNSLKQSFL